MRLRQYKSCDAKEIVSWIRDEDTFIKWSAGRFGSFPIEESTINEKYLLNNGDCEEQDNFYPWTALDDSGKPVGHFIMRYTDGNSKNIRFGFVILDNTARGNGYGKQMLLLGMKYAFEILGADSITIGVFENNDPAHWCYKKVGFKDKEVQMSEFGNIVEMEIPKEDWLS